MSYPGATQVGLGKKLLEKYPWHRTKAFWRTKEESPSAQGYHWNTNAETYYLIGEAMGKSMLGLVPLK